MNAPTGLHFPDEPKSELDLALAALMPAAARVAATQGRLRSLLRANKTIVEQLDLSTMLRSIIEAAIDLVGARYGALGVMSPEGGLEEFIQVGIDDETVARIGHLPEGHGLLGAVLEVAHPIRLENIQSDPRSSGYPAAHPDMHGFLGVPIRVRDQLFGSLYFAEKMEGDFTREDEELLTSLASTAGIAIENARLFEETQRRQRWSTLSTAIATSLLSTDTEEPLRLLAGGVAELADADLVCVVLPLVAGSLIIDTARGTLAGDMQGLVLAAAGTLSGRVLGTGEAELVSSLSTCPELRSQLPTLGPSMLIPLLNAEGPIGVLVVSRALGSRRLTDEDVVMATDFARQGTLAIDVAHARTDRHRLERLEDRSRIARDLHDHVIQRLFASGLELQAAARATSDDTAHALIEHQIDTLDTAIAEIRTAIYALTPPRHGARASLRHRVIDLLAETQSMFTRTPRLTFLGRVDLLVDDELADDVLAVVREALSNVARHAAATLISVSISVHDGQIVAEITDDGVGITPTGRSSGLSNMTARAERWQGTMDATARAEGGTLVRWTGQLAQLQQSGVTA
jgi:signal transduction histidine kinase